MKSTMFTEIKNKTKIKYLTRVNCKDFCIIFFPNTSRKMQAGGKKTLFIVNHYSETDALD